MPDEPLSPQLRQFILDCIDSVAQLEILLLLQTNPTEAWSAERMARELRIAPSGAGNELDVLTARQLLAISSENPRHYRYGPASPEIAALAVQVAQAYLLLRVTVIGEIFSKPSDNLRVFADAFRIRSASTPSSEPPGAGQGSPKDVPDA